MVELYLPMFLVFLVAAVLVAVFFLGGQLLGPKNPTAEKMMPFECGNDSDGAKGIKLNVKFYLTAILFVVFDIETVFIFPWAVLFKGLGWAGFATMLAFVSALIIGLVYCWKKGALEWDN